MNAVNRPYRENSEVVRNLQRDGIKFFAVSPPHRISGQSIRVDSLYGKQVLLFMRIGNLLLTIFSPVSPSVLYTRNPKLTSVRTSAYRDPSDCFVRTFPNQSCESCTTYSCTPPQLPLGHRIDNALSVPSHDQSRGARRLERWSRARHAHIHHRMA